MHEWRICRCADLSIDFDKIDDSAFHFNRYQINFKQTARCFEQRTEFQWENRFSLGNSIRNCTHNEFIYWFQANDARERARERVKKGNCIEINNLRRCANAYIARKCGFLISVCISVSPLIKQATLIVLSLASASSLTFILMFVNLQSRYLHRLFHSLYLVLVSYPSYSVVEMVKMTEWNERMDARANERTLKNCSYPIYYTVD